LHTSRGIAERRGLLCRLTRDGVGMDFGRGAEFVTDARAISIHAAYPRLEIEHALVEIVVEQARCTPSKAPRFSTADVLLLERATAPHTTRLERDAPTPAGPHDSVSDNRRAARTTQARPRSPRRRREDGNQPNTVIGGQRSRSRMDTMHAVRAHARGGPEQLVYEEVSRPEPGPGEALVAVKAASITPDELTWPETWTYTSDGTGPDRTPIIPSHEFSGVVAALGADVEGPAVGEAVYGLIPFARDGAAADYVTVPAAVLAAKPATIDHDHAAALPLAGLSALQALLDHAGLEAGQHVLVQGGAGGVGSYVVQLAANLGARVSATASGADLEFVKGLGAEQVIDYARDRFEDHVREVDVVVDLVGGSTQSRSWSVLKPGGILVSLSAPPDQQEATRHGVRGVYFIVEPDREGLRYLAELVDNGRLTPVVNRVLPLTETRSGYEALEQGGRRGKIVIHVADTP
jgi:NADPH:quinone reductase-like Zn-dependent oxidoreductase